MSPAKTILVTGGAGQVASELAKAGGADIRRVGRPEFDFDRPETIDEIVETIKPSIIVNAAAWTAVDAAEKEVEAAYRANRDGPARLAALAAEQDIPFIHISTDYVFDGLKASPYVETDAVSPTGVYGASKLEGERAVLTAYPASVILRTSWVYAANGKNFVRTMLNASQKMPQLRVVADQIGCPTTAVDLAAAILALIPQLLDGKGADLGGIYHVAGTGWTSWHGLATAIFEESASLLPSVPEVLPIKTTDWPTPAKRPPDSRLDCTKLKATFGIELPPWRDGLTRTIKEIYA